MSRSTRMMRLVILALGLLALTGLPPRAGAQLAAPGRALEPPTPAQAPAMVAPQPGPPSALILKADQLTKQQFETLPGNAVIELKDGTRTTAGEIRAQVARLREELQAEVQAQAGQAKAKFEAYRASFLKAQKAKREAENAKVQAELARLKQGSPRPLSRHEAIRKEASQLLERAKTASPAEQAQIEQRAGELLKQLQQLPR